MKNAFIVLSVICFTCLFPIKSSSADDISDIVEYVNPAMVSILSGKQVIGSGFIINPEGYVITCAHVVEKNNKVTLKLLDGQNIDTTVLQTDTEKDLAILKSNQKNLPCVRLINSKPKAGQNVFTVGSPMGMEFTVTRGVVSDPERKLAGNTYIQTDLAINAGNSGSPLFNDKGQVIGINTLKLQDSEGISFATPISAALELLEKKNISAEIVLNDAIGTNDSANNPSQIPNNEQTDKDFNFKPLATFVAILLPLLVILFVYRYKRKKRLVLDDSSSNLAISLHEQNNFQPEKDDLDDVDIQLK